MAAAIPFVLPPIVETVVVNRLGKMGYPAELHLQMGYEWTPRGPGLYGKLNASLDNTVWEIAADFGVSFLEWHANVHLPKTEFSESENLVRKLLTQFPVTAVSNLTFSGSVALDASVRRTPGMPVPVWSAKADVRDMSADLVAGDAPISVRKLNLTPSVSGIADHVDIAPLYVRAKSIQAAEFTLTNVYAAVRAEQKLFLVTEAGAGFCGGKISLFSLFLDPEKLNAGFSLFVDNLDAGQVLSHIQGFHGKASGLLHGKIRLFIAEGGKRLRLRDAFLYSSPGEVGKVQIADSSALTDKLELAGIAQSERENVANVLTDVDYSVLKIDMNRTEKNTTALGIKLQGNATRGKLTVPVVVNLMLRGDIEQLINTGLKISNQGKTAQP